MMWFIVSVMLTLCSTIGILLRYAPFETSATPHQKRVVQAWSIVLTAVHFCVLFGILRAWKTEAVFLYLRFGMILYAGLLALVNILAIPGRIREHLFVFGVVSACKYLLLSIPNYLITLLRGLTQNQYLCLILVSYLLLLMAAYIPLRRLLCSAVTPILHLVDGTYWSTVWFIPIALLGTRVLYAGGEHNAGGLLQLLNSALSGTVIIFMCLSISRDHRQIQAHRDLEQQLLNQKLHYSELQTRVEDARKTKHDLKHHMAAILHFVELNERENARIYCMDLIDRMESRESIPYTGNAAVDGILYHYMQRAAMHKIELQSMGIIRNPGIADLDLCVLLGNALDNAVEGCLRVPENRSIQVVSQLEGHLLSVMIRNTFDGKVEQSAEGLLSRKRDHAQGIGIRSMEEICRTYGGSMEIQYDESTFTVMFVLPLQG